MISLFLDPGDAAGSALFFVRALLRCDNHPHMAKRAGRAACIAHAKALPVPDLVVIEDWPIFASNSKRATATQHERRGEMVGIAEVLWPGARIEALPVAQWQAIHAGHADPTSEGRSLAVVLRYLNGRPVDLHWRGAKGGIVGDAVSAAAMGVWWWTLRGR